MATTPWHVVVVMAVVVGVVAAVTGALLALVVMRRLRQVTSPSSWAAEGVLDTTGLPGMPSASTSAPGASPATTGSATALDKVVSATSAAPVSSATVVPAAVRQPVRIIYGDVDQPMISITRWTPRLGVRYEPVRITSGLESGLRLFLENAANLASSGSHLGQNAYMLQFSRNTLEALDGGRYTLMPSRAIAVDEFGKIREHARLVPTTAMDVAQMATGAWQVLATVTLQRYIMEIEQRLSRLEAGVEEIRSWLEGNEFASLSGSIRYIREARKWLSATELSSVEVTAFIGELETIDRDANRSMELMRSQLEALLGTLRARKFSGFTRASWVEALSDQIMKYELWSRAYLTAIALKGICAQLRGTLLLGREVALVRIESIRSDLAEQRRLQLDFLRLVRVQIRALSGTWGRAATKAAYQSTLRSVLKRGSSSLRVQVRELRSAVDSTTTILEGPLPAGEHLALVIEVGDRGQVRKVARLLESAPHPPRSASVGSTAAAPAAGM